MKTEQQKSIIKTTPAIEHFYIVASAWFITCIIHYTNDYQKFSVFQMPLPRNDRKIATPTSRSKNIQRFNNKSCECV